MRMQPGYALPPSAAFLPSPASAFPAPTGGTPAVDGLFPHWRVGYHHGFVIAPVNPEETPFELRVNGTFQFRYTGFARSDQTWTDSAGEVRDIDNRNDIQMPRSLVVLNGYAHDPNLVYTIWIGGTTNEPGALILPDVGYKVSEAFIPHIGIGRIPFGSEFIIPDFTTQFVDRSMATTFFQADFALGLSAFGKLNPKHSYWVMLANGQSSYAIPAVDLDTHFVGAGAYYWDPIGEYGKIIPDLEYHECPALRFCTSGLLAPQRAQPNGEPFPEADYVRLSDGTPLVETGALAPGVTVNSFNEYGLAQSVQFKYRGLSLFGEGLFQWLNGFGADGVIPNDRLNLFTSGYTLQGGYFITPHALEVGLRTSQVYGQFGRAQEYTGGLTYYFQGHPLHKVSLDVQRLLNNPGDNYFTGYTAGQSGFMTRLQYEIGF
jgi:hypothetical protein